MERPEEALASLHQRCNGFSSPAFTPAHAREITAYIEHLEKKVAEAPFVLPGCSITDEHEHWDSRGWTRERFGGMEYSDAPYIVRKRRKSAAERVLEEVIENAPWFVSQREIRALVDDILANGTYVPNESQQ